MALNVPIAVYRGTRTNLASLATTGHAGILAWTTDTNEFFVDQGSGTAGIGGPGSGAAWIPVGNSISYFTAASQAAMLALNAKVGDHVDRTDLKQIFILLASPASTLANWQAISPDASVTGITGLAGATASQWVSYIGTDGTQHLSQPAFTDISGRITQSQLPALIDCGTF